MAFGADGSSGPSPMIAARRVRNPELGAIELAAERCWRDADDLEQDVHCTV